MRIGLTCVIFIAFSCLSLRHRMTRSVFASKMWAAELGPTEFGERIIWNTEADAHCSRGSKIHLVQYRSPEQTVGIGELLPNLEMIVALHD